jgi:phosphatidylethanolamine-binding protein
VANSPSLGFETITNDTFMAVLIDFSIQLPSVAGNQTLLHWIQPGFSTAQQLLQSNAAPIAPFLPIGPPPGQTHTYGVFLYAQSTPNFTIPEDYDAYFKNLTTSVQNRIGFDLDKFVQDAGLEAPLAADFFLVHTPKNSSMATSSMAAPTQSSVSSTAGAASASATSMQVATGAGMRGSRASLRLLYSAFILLVWRI